MQGRNREVNEKNSVQDDMNGVEHSNVDRLKGDARELLNSKRAANKSQETSNIEVQPAMKPTSDISDRGCEQKGAGRMGVDLAENNGGKSHIDGPRSADVNAQTTAGDTGMGNIAQKCVVEQNRVEHGVNNSVAADRVGKETSVSKNSAILHCPNATDGMAGPKNSIVVQQEVGTTVNAVVIVPVTAALNRVVNDLKAATAGVSKGPGAGQKSVEAGHQTSKGQGTTSVQKLTEATGVLAIKDGQFTAESHKEPATQADVDRGINSLVPGDQNSVGQETIGVGAVDTTNATGAKAKEIKDALHDVSDHDTPKKPATTPIKSDAKSNNWKVVNKSPSKKQSPRLQNQIVPSKAIGVSNSFDALVNGDGHVNEEQQMDDETRPIAGKTNSTGSEKQQKNAKDSFRLESGGNHTGETNQILAADTPTLHISNPELDKMVNDAQAAMMMNTTPKSKQLQYPGSSKQQQLAKNTGGRLIVSKDIVPVDAQNAEAIQLSTATTMSSTPKLHISSPEVAKIIKETQMDMMMNAKPLIRQPLVALNTSVQDER